MGFFRRLLYRFSDFMQGRYGMDDLYIPMLIISCVFTLIGSFARLWFFRLAGTIVLILMVLRFFSKNYTARQKELYAYYGLKNAISQWFGKQKSKYTNRKSKRYFKCPKCKATLSVPKGKGKILITCTVCKHQFQKKS